MENMLDAKEASGLLGISEEKLKGLVDRKVVPAYMVAGQFLRFKKQEIEAIKGLLSEKTPSGRERVLNQAFIKVTGFEKFKEFLRANGIYLFFLAAAAVILFFLFFK